MIDADDISFFKKAVEFSFESRKRLFPAEIIRKNDFYSLKKRNGENHISHRELWLAHLN